MLYLLAHRIIVNSRTDKPEKKSMLYLRVSGAYNSTFLERSVLRFPIIICASWIKYEIKRTYKVTVYIGRCLKRSIDRLVYLHCYLFNT